jgi:excisionase family DNA binding protein
MGRSANTRRKAALPFGDFPSLSKTAETFVRQHPGQARKLVAAALEAAAVQQSPPPSRTQVPATLKRFVVQPRTGAELISISEAALRLAISRTTAYDWVEKKRMIGWKATKAGTMIPGEQIVGTGELVKGIDRVLDAIGDPRAAWRFLDEPSAFFAKPSRPIDLLKQGEIAAVMAAVEAHGEAFA